jgi:hypothetical protein
MSDLKLAFINFVMALGAAIRLLPIPFGVGVGIDIGIDSSRVLRRNMIAPYASAR